MITSKRELLKFRRDFIRNAAKRSAMLSQVEVQLNKAISHHNAFITNTLADMDYLFVFLYDEEEFRSSSQEVAALDSQSPQLP